MTESEKYLNLIRTQKNNSLIHFRSFQNFHSKYDQIESSERKIIKFAIQKQKEELDKLQWRKNTEFPIVKILTYKKLNNQYSSPQKYISKKILVQLTIQPILYTLSDVDQIPIFKVFYLLKQTLIAAQRLCNLYGNFIVKSNMISIDLKKKCKVWHNSKFHINKPQDACQNEQETIRSIIDLFSMKTKKSIKSSRFYRDLQKCRSFCDCLFVLKSFTIHSQIRVPSSFILIDNFSSNMCSPRKYISRPPSNEKNPQSPQHSLQKSNNNIVHPSHKASQSQAWRYAKSPQMRPKVNQFFTSRSIYNENKYSRKGITLNQKQISLNNLRKTPRFQQVQRLHPRNLPITRLFSSRNKNTLGIIQSVFEDSQYPSVNDLQAQPQIRLLQPIIKDEQEDINTDTILYRSSISMGCSIKQQESSSENYFSKNKLQATNDQPILPLRRQKNVQVFHPLMKLIDQSFDDLTHIHV